MSQTGDGKITYTIGSRCGIENCKSRKYHIDEGFTYCKNGHQQDIPRDFNVESSVTAATTQGLTTQPREEDFASQRHKTHQKKDVEEHVPKKYSGQQAVQLYLQSYQLILWKQCYALIHTIGLPAELEGVVKDLWALRLQLVTSEINEQFDADSVFSSQPESKTEAASRKYDERRERKVKGNNMPTLIESLGLCYIGMILLRLPVGLGELHRYLLPAFMRVYD
ncbi:Pol I core factor CF [Pseudocyphellaria aurata]|nr:Pol I core factor CF [Pseudocyphellaria aurata]